jgi:hypothetical protein
MVTDSMKLTFIKTLKEKDGPVLIADVSELPGVAIRYDGGGKYIIDSNGLRSEQYDGYEKAEAELQRQYDAA